MGKRDCLIGWIGLAFVCLVPALLLGAEPEMLVLGRFSAMAPEGEVSEWEPLTFKKIKSHTRYTLVADLDGATVLKADSRASASGLVRRITLPADDYPWISWRWKVSNILKKGDVRKKAGDDYAARIYITFAEDPDGLSFIQRTKLAAAKLIYGEQPPSAALTYVWGNRAAVGSIHPNPYTNRVQMIVVDSGPAQVNQWRAVRRNIVADFRRAFGTQPPPITAVAVMTDTDNTAAAVTAWYGDITLSKTH